MRPIKQFPESKFVLYTLVSERERYWTGVGTVTGLPATTYTVDDARKFDTAQAAYAFANANLRRFPLLDYYHVGRRPLPLALPLPRHRKVRLQRALAGKLSETIEEGDIG